MPDTATPDTATPDTSTPDTSSPDTGMPDTGMPDTRPPDTAPPPSCASQYSSAAGVYVECVQTDSTCEFYTNPPGSTTCDAVCTLGGGTCVDAWRELGTCTHREDRTCTSTMNDMICLCSRGPGT